MNCNLQICLFNYRLIKMLTAQTKQNKIIISKLTITNYKFYNESIVLVKY